MLGKILKDIYRRTPVDGSSTEGVKSLRQSETFAEEIRRLAADVELRAREVRAATNNVNTANVIRLVDFELDRNPRYADERRLLKYGFQVCSQNAEDGMIHEIFRRIGTGNRVFAEIGISDGTENNTAFLLSQGWTGFWVDGDDTFRRILAARADLQGDCIKSVVSFVTKENVADLFAELGVPEEFDLLSLDIDQNTYYVWEALATYRPRVVVVEYNALLPPDIDWKVHYESNRVWNGTSNFGASLKAFELLGRQVGYELVGCDFIGVNAFFVRSDMVGDRFAGPFTSENHYEPPRYALSHRRGHRTAILDRPYAVGYGPTADNR
jgi:hypothetical protein